MNGLDKFPIPNQFIRDGNLSNYILPMQGYNVEEASGGSGFRDT